MLRCSALDRESSLWCLFPPPFELHSNHFDSYSTQPKKSREDSFVGLVRRFVPMFFPLPGVSGASVTDDLLMF